MQLVSERIDPLSYGGQWENLAVSFQMINITSWGEVLTFRYAGRTALLDCLCDYFAWSPVNTGNVPPPFPASAFPRHAALSSHAAWKQLFHVKSPTFSIVITGDAMRAMHCVSDSTTMSFNANTTCRATRNSILKLPAESSGHSRNLLQPDPHRYANTGQLSVATDTRTQPRRCGTAVLPGAGATRACLHP